MFPIFCALVAGVVILAVVFAYNKKVREQGRLAAMTAAPAQIARFRTSYELETEEDLEAIRDAYLEDRRHQRARMALERVGRIVPESPASATQSKSNAK